MANPQIEDGHTKIANEIMDALCKTRIPGEERQVLDVIMRKTYGWNKCEDAISLSQFVESTGINKPCVVRAIHGLLSKKIIIVIKKDNAPAKVYKINKDFDTWEPLSKKIMLSKKIISVIKKDNPSLSKKIPTKDTTTKDTTTKASMSDFLVFYQAYPKHEAKEPALKAWKKLNGTRPPLETLLKAVETQKQTDGWQRDGGKYIPLPASWLNAKRWEDEVDPPKPKSVFS